MPGDARLGPDGVLKESLSASEPAQVMSLCAGRFYACATKKCLALLTIHPDEAPDPGDPASQETELNQNVAYFTPPFQHRERVLPYSAGKFLRDV